MMVPHHDFRLYLSLSRQSFMERLRDWSGMLYVLYSGVYFSAEDFHEPQGSGDERMAGRVGQIMDAKIELSSGACAMYSILVIFFLRTRNCTFIPP